MCTLAGHTSAKNCSCKNAFSHCDSSYLSLSNNLTGLWVYFCTDCVNFWPIMPTFDRFCRPLTDCVDFWPIMSSSMTAIICPFLTLGQPEAEMRGPDLHCSCCWSPIASPPTHQHSQLLLANILKNVLVNILIPPSQKISSFSCLRSV